MTGGARLNELLAKARPWKPLIVYSALIAGVAGLLSIWEWRIGAFIGFALVFSLTLRIIEAKTGFPVASMFAGRYSEVRRAEPADIYREALEEIRRLPKGHDCYGYCRQMYRIADDALGRGLSGER